MPEHTTSPRPPSRPRRRRRLVAGCVVVAASLALAGCGTANGALRPEPSTTVSVTAPPTSSTSSAGAPSSGAPVSARPSAPGPASKPAAPRSGTPSPAAPRSGTPKPPPPATTPTPAPAAATTTPAPPVSGVSTAVVRSTASGGRTVALTFDDGPGRATGEILDLLARYGAKATFCQIGRQAAADPAVVKRIRAAGHRLCDHSVNHPQPFASLTHEKAVYEISAAKDMIVQAGGPGTEVPWFRAPGGGFTADNQRVAADHGLRPLGWSVDPRDWSRPGVASIVSTVQSQLRPGGVILLHDGGGDRGQTVAALKQLLPWLVAQGYRFDFPAR
ncbi:polysaccharide deacetylase family protein [Kitasatospora sp. NPDC059327]|uniref:polysaccharide deacetylase family protein n=1 Tax=Kitasatospora sp. NPDC059327 TaxID=3346803 RepID=UPI003677A3B0